MTETHSAWEKRQLTRMKLDLDRISELQRQFFTEENATRAKRILVRLDKAINRTFGGTDGLAGLVARGRIKKQAEEAKRLAAQDRPAAEAEIDHWQRQLCVEDPYLDGMQVAWCQAKDKVAIAEGGHAQGQHQFHLDAYTDELRTRNVYLHLLRNIAHAMQFKPHRPRMPRVRRT